MRIIGYIDHAYLKITVFKMDDKVSIKLESGMYEQTYKFRSGEGVETMEDARKFVTPVFITQVEEILATMHKTRLAGLVALNPLSEEDFFDEII